VLLSGAGGDDIFSGYRRHAALAAERLWDWAPGAARRVAARAARGASSGHGPWRSHAPWTRRVAKALSYADLAADDRMVRYFWWSPDALRRELYTPAVSAAVGGHDAAAPLRASLAAVDRGRAPLDRMLHLEITHFLADHNLNYTDKTGMAAGVEVRVPLLDLELVRFAARIPPGLKQRGREGKWIFKRAMEPDLPRDVIYRAKTGFGAPLRRWLRRELRGRVEDLLSPASLRARGLFDPAAVGRLVERDRAGTVDGSYTIFALMCTELWCRLFADRPVPVLDEFRA
jgi:asparagine synthase (glutamine-hydrolysing)